MSALPEPNPYAPPSRDTDTPPTQTPSVGEHRYVALDGSVRLAVTLLGGWAVVTLVNLVCAFNQYDLLDRMARHQFTMEEVTANDARITAVAALQIIAFVIAAAAAARVLMQANRNLRALGVEGLTYTPGWTVGWFFVPFANLVRPFQAVRELWTASAPRDDRFVPEAPIQMNLWWAAWLAMNFAGRIAGASTKTTEIPGLQSATVFSIVSDVLGLIAASLFVWLLRGIAARIADKRAAR